MIKKAWPGVGLKACDRTSKWEEMSKWDEQSVVSKEGNEERREVSRCETVLLSELILVSAPWQCEFCLARCPSLLSGTAQDDRQHPRSSEDRGRGLQGSELRGQTAKGTGHLSSILFGLEAGRTCLSSCLCRKAQFFSHWDTYTHIHSHSWPHVLDRMDVPSAGWMFKASRLRLEASFSNLSAGCPVYGSNTTFLPSGDRSSPGVGVSVTESPWCRVLDGELAWLTDDGPERGCSNVHAEMRPKLLMKGFLVVRHELGMFLV